MKSDGKATGYRICPSCGFKIADRVDSDGRDSGAENLHSNSGPSLKHYEGPVGYAGEGGITFHHYIPRDQIKEWEALGWKVTELGPYHDQFSVLGEWVGEGEPRKP